MIRRLPYKRDKASEQDLDTKALVVSGVSPDVVGALVPAVWARLVNAVFALYFAETWGSTQGPHQQ